MYNLSRQKFGTFWRESAGHRHGRVRAMHKKKATEAALSFELGMENCLAAATTATVATDHRKGRKEVGSQ